MLKIRYRDVPTWLRDSVFYSSLNVDEIDNYIEIPVTCHRATDESVHTVEDAVHILKVISFWGVRSIPQSLLEFCYLNDFALWGTAFSEIDEMVSPEHQALKKALQYSNLFSLAVELSTELPEMVLFWFHKNTGDGEHGKYAIAQACGYGRLDLVQTLHERSFPWDGYAYCAAAQNGHLRVLQYLYENECLFDEKALVFAARGGQVECMKYLHSVHCPWSKEVTLEYAIIDHYDLLKYNTTEFNLPWADNRPFSSPVGGYVECLHFALQSGCPIHEAACERVCTYGLLCLQLLYHYGGVWSVATTRAAAINNHIRCLEYLHNHGCPWDKSATEGAVRNGHFECLQYLHEHHCPWDETAANVAAKDGRLVFLRYLHEHNCPFGAFASVFAAAHGQLTCLQYLHANGATCNELTVRSAAASGHLGCLKFLHANDCPWNVGVTAATARAGHTECLRYSIDHGCVYDCGIVLKAAIVSGKVRCLQYLVEEVRLKHLLNGTLFGEALLSCNVSCVKNLMEIGCPFYDYSFSRPWPCDIVNDAAFLQCIQCAVQHGWQYNVALLELMQEDHLPLCRAYVKAERWEEKLFTKDK